MTGVEMCRKTLTKTCRILGQRNIHDCVVEECLGSFLVYQLSSLR